MKIYGSERVHEFYNRAVFLEGDKEPEFLKYKIVKPFQSFLANGYKIWAFRALHGEKNGDCLFYAVSDGVSSILYAHDTGKFDEQIYEYMLKEGLYFNIVSLDCTHQNCASSDCHMNLEGNIEVKERLLSTGLADENTSFVLNHFSHNGRMGYEEMKILERVMAFWFHMMGLRLLCESYKIFWFQAILEQVLGGKDII